MPTHNRIYIASSHTKKIFGNMRRVGKGFSGRETPLIQTMVKQKLRKPKRKDTQISQSSGPTEHVTDEAIYKELDDSLATPNEVGSQGTTSGGGPRGSTLQSGEGSLKHKELMELCINLQTRGRINAIDADEDITLVNDQDDADMFDVNTLTGDEVLAEQEVAAKDVNLTVDEDKGKGILVEELVKKLSKKKDLIRLDEEIASKLQAEFDEKERLKREKDEANVAILHTLKNGIIFRLRKHFAAKRAEEKRNRPPTRAQQRNIMCTYLKNMEGWKPKSLKNKSFANIQELFEKAIKRTFIDYRTELVKESSKKAEIELEENLKKAEAEVMEGSSKRAGEELEQESIKKQKVDEDKETAELQSLIEVIPDEEEVAIDVVPLATKPPTIVDWKIHKEGKKSYYQIIRADGKSQMYRVFSQMLKSFSREDLEDLYKLVKAKYGSTRPVEDLDLILYGDLKTMFEPHVEDQVWKNQDDYNVLDWKLYDSCGVHSLRMQHVYIHMLVEKRYPLTPSTITDMLNKKLQVDYLNEMAYQLLKLLTK
ncbi:hypothetical protein Tco_1315097 [Tanacetum coccineum]